MVTRLARVGYDNTLGFLKGGLTAWENANKETDSIVSITPQELAQIQQKNTIEIIDVRKANEHLSEHILNTQNIELDYINQKVNDLDKNKTYYIHCASGYRSMIFNSILRARGYHNLIDINGGFTAIKQSNLFNLSNFVCPSTL